MFVSADENDDNDIDLNQPAPTKTEEKEEELTDDYSIKNQNKSDENSTEWEQKPNIPSLSDININDFLSTLPPTNPNKQSQHTLFYKKNSHKKYKGIQFQQIDSSSYRSESPQGNQLALKFKNPYNKNNRDTLQWNNEGDFVSLTLDDYKKHKKRKRKAENERSGTIKYKHKLYLKLREKFEAKRKLKAAETQSISPIENEEEYNRIDLDDGWVASTTSPSSSNNYSNQIDFSYSEERFEETSDIFNIYNKLRDLLNPTMPTEIYVANMNQWATRIERSVSVDPLIVKIKFGEACRNAMRSTDLEKLSYFQGLMGLTLSNCECTDQGFSALKTLTKLEYLCIDSCPQLTDASMATISTMKQLRHLNLTNLSLITDNGINTLVSSSTSDTATEPNSSPYPQPLCSVELSMCPNITNNAIIMLSRLPSLVRIHLNNCANITNPGIEQLSKRLPYLRSLGVSKIYGITATELKKAIYRMPFLEELDVSHRSSIDDSFFKPNTQLLQSVKRPPDSDDNLLEHLKDLDISGTQVGDSGLAAIVENCKNLERLTMAWCSKVTRQGVDILARSISLQFVDARDNNKINKYLRKLHQQNSLVVQFSE